MIGEPYFIVGTKLRAEGLIFNSFVIKYNLSSH